MSSVAHGSPERPLKDAVLAWLTSDSGGVMALVTAVVDTPPRQERTDYPYVVVDSPRLLRDGAMQALMWQFSFELHTWSERNGKKETQDIHDALLARLDRAPLSVTGYHLIDLAAEYVDIFRDEDVETPATSRYHGVTRWQGRLEQAA